MNLKKIDNTGTTDSVLEVTFTHSTLNLTFLHYIILIGSSVMVSKELLQLMPTLDLSKILFSLRKINLRRTSVNDDKLHPS